VVGVVERSSIRQAKPSDMRDSAVRNTSFNAKGGHKTVNVAIMATRDTTTDGSVTNEWRGQVVFGGLALYTTDETFDNPDTAMWKAQTEFAAGIEYAIKQAKAEG
jgi:hypothetical protein